MQMEGDNNMPDSLPKRNWFGVAAGVCGIIFVLFDIGSDILLIYQYQQDAMSYEKYLTWATNHSISSTRPIHKCKKLSYRSTNQLGDHSINFMWATICFVGLGGIIQTAIGTVKICLKHTTFDILPKLVKVITLLVCPLLMGPVVISLYLVIRCAQGADAEEVMKYKLIIGTLKMGEIIFESIPQLLLNAVSLILQCGTEEFTPVYSNITKTKAISIFTSMLGVAYSISDWIVKGGTKQFVSQNHHPAVSFVGVFTWLISTLFFYFTGIITLYGNGTLNTDIKAVTAVVFLILELLAFVLIFTSACSRGRCCKKFKAITCILHLLLNMAMFVFVAGFLSNLSKSMTRYVFATLIIFALQLVLGVFILLSSNLRGKLVHPLVKVLLYLLGTLTCGKIDGKISKFKEWKSEEEQSSDNGEVEGDDLTEMGVLIPK